MKTFFRALTLGILMVVLTGGLATSTNAQDDEKTTLYTTYTDNYASPEIEKRRLAVTAAKEYIAKFGNSADDKEIVDYLKSAIPAIEKGIEDQIAKEKAAAERAVKQARYNKFDASFKAKNWDATYQVGQEIIAAEPKMLDVALVLGSIGLDEASKNPPNDKFNEATVKYATLAIELMNSGVTSKNYGAFAIYEYETADNAKGWMNYNAGMIMYHREGRTNPAIKKDALNYLYASTQSNSDRKDEPRTYGSIGEWYFNEASTLVAKRNVILTESKKLIDERNKTKVKEEQDELDKKIDALEARIDDSIALEKAYADRALDAYARAYNLAKANPKETADYKNSLMSAINALYSFRYVEPAMKTPEKINMYLSGVMSKPMPHPATAVTPVVDTPTSVSAPAKTGNR